MEKGRREGSCIKVRRCLADALDAAASPGTSEEVSEGREIGCVVNVESQEDVEQSSKSVNRDDLEIYATSFKVLYHSQVGVCYWIKCPRFLKNSTRKQSLLLTLLNFVWSLHQHSISNLSVIPHSPLGVVSFLSDLYTGSISDKELTKSSGLYEFLCHGDDVMADKGFDIKDDLAKYGVTLNIPAFLKGKMQFSKEQTEHNKKIASLRIQHTYIMRVLAQIL